MLRLNEDGMTMLNFKESGRGEPVVLIHGLFGNLDNLAACGRHLEAQGYRVIRVDLSCHGESPTQAQMSYHSMAADLIQLLDHLAITEFRVVGHSMGGKVAMMLALLHPERVSQLVVADIAPVSYDSHHTQVFKGLDTLWEQKPASRAEADQLLSHSVADQGVRQFLLKNLKWTAGSLHWRLRYPEVKSSYPNILDWPELEASYSKPTLFLKGALSEYITESSRPAIGQYFPKAKAHIIADTGHWLHAEKPEPFNRAVARFFAA